MNERIRIPLNLKTLDKDMKSIRRSFDLTMTEVSDFTGASTSRISEYETGKCIPQLRTLIPILGVYQCRLVIATCYECLVNKEHRYEH